MIVTRGMGTDQMLVTRGYGTFEVVIVTAREIVNLISRITTSITMRSSLNG